MTRHEFKENKLSPGNCIACGLSFDSDIHAFKAPENKQRQALREPTQMDEAPEEDWVKEFDQSFIGDLGSDSEYFHKTSVAEIRTFITTLIQKEREKAKEEGYVARGGAESEQKQRMFDAGIGIGRKDALQSVREVVTGMKLKETGDPSDILGMKQANAYNAALDDFLSKLSQLTKE